ncbi:MAG: T9SS type A sorting domain-containing protein, partial [Crocinitomicaceae bacterium]|nr:T9SS type A sorting domain-containing protein [Crocinitomicaceae bacterium]
QIWIESDENIFEVQAIDMFGKSVKTEQISKGQFIINEGVVGTYFLDIVTKNDVVQLKIIIQ